MKSWDGMAVVGQMADAQTAVAEGPEQIEPAPSGLACQQPQTPRCGRSVQLDAAVDSSNLAAVQPTGGNFPPRVLALTHLDYQARSGKLPQLDHSQQSGL